MIIKGRQGKECEGGKKDFVACEGMEPMAKGPGGAQLMCSFNTLKKQVGEGGGEEV